MVKLPKEMQIRKKKERELKKRLKQMVRTKEQLIYENFGYTKEEMKNMLTKTTDDNQLAWARFIIYLYDYPTKARFEELLNNGDLLVRQWDKIKTMITEIKIDEFEEYPVVKKYYEIWLNSLIGEYYYVRYFLDTPYSDYIDKYSKRLFLKFGFESFEKIIPKRVPDQEKAQSAYYQHKYTDDELRDMRELGPEGYPGFFVCFVPNPKSGGMQLHINYDNRWLRPEAYTDPQLIPMKIQEIFYKYNSGEIK